MFQSPLRWPNGWPVTHWNERRSDRAFQTTPGKAVDDLYSELRKLRADHVLISTNLPLSLKGAPILSDAISLVREPGVVLHFQRGDRPFCLAQDAFSTIFGNLRSVGLAIEALRQMERHGGDRLAARAFDGFAALPSPSAAKQWRAVLGITTTGNRSD